MSIDDRKKWDLRYGDGAYANRGYPSEFLENRIPELKIGRALDLACGAGRNAIYLAELGFKVDALDISSVGLDIAKKRSEEIGVSVNWINQDLLANWQSQKQKYDLILMFRFVSSELLVKLPQLLTRGGSLLVEEHLHWPEGNVVGPTSDRFRVMSGELSAACKGLNVMFEYEGLVDEPDGSVAALSQIHAKKT